MTEKATEVEDVETARCAECGARVRLVYIGAALALVLNFHLDGLRGGAPCAGSYLPASGTAVAR